MSPELPISWRNLKQRLARSRWFRQSEAPGPARPEPRLPNDASERQRKTHLFAKNLKALPDARRRELARGGRVSREMGEEKPGDLDKQRADKEKK